MTRKSPLADGLALMLSVVLAAQAQAVEPTLADSPVPAVAEASEPIADDAEYAPYATASWQPSYGLEAESLPAEIAEDIWQDRPAPGLGPTPILDVRFLMDNLGLAGPLEARGIRAFGWVEGGYTYASGGPGLMSVQPRQNRSGDELLLNQIGLVVQKPLCQDDFDIGWNVRYFAGADAALGQPGGSSMPPPG